MKRTIAAACSAALLAVSPSLAQTPVSMIVFGGATNLPVWLAVEHGFFEKEGLKVELQQTRGSKQQMAELMAGKHQFATTAFDNIVAHTEGQGSAQYDNYDLIAIGGVHSGLNSVLTRPEVKSYADLKGKVAAVDSPKSGYATVLYEILAGKGLVRDRDYTIISVGNSAQRVAALKDGKAHVAIVSSPLDMQLAKEGYNILADAAAEMGAFQGSAYATRRSWAKENPKQVAAFMRAVARGHQMVFNDKEAAIAMLRKRSKGLSDADLETMWKRLTGPGGLSSFADINTKGVATVLRLRGLAGDGSKYMDLSFQPKK